MAVKVAVIGGKKYAIALQAISDKVTKGGTLRVGFLEGATYPAVEEGPNQAARPALPVAQVAFWNEFGTTRAPPRPFFRTTIAQESSTWGTKLAKALIYYNYDGETALRALGQSMRDDLEAQIIRWTTPPNAEYTVRRKGFNKPLVHTGQMARTPDFEIAP